MEINYKNFKTDCIEIIQPTLEKYGYQLDVQKSDDYTNYYVNHNGYIEVSMVQNFPFIGVTLSYYPLDLKFIKPSLIDEILGVSMVEKTKFYSDFKKLKDLNNYEVQMQFSIELMREFYAPILKGELNLNEIDY